MQQFHKFYYLTFMCGSTCFGCLSAHYQESTTALGASGFYRWSVVVAALLVMVWQTTTNNAATAMLQRQNQRLLMQLYAPDDGRGSARNMLSHT